MIDNYYFKYYYLVRKITRTNLSEGLNPKRSDPIENQSNRHRPNDLRSEVMVVSGTDRMVSQNNLPQGLRTIEYDLECRPRSEGHPIARWSDNI